MENNFWKVLNTQEMKNVLGGSDDEEFASCSFLCYCTSTHWIRAKCNTGECSGSDGVGGWCNGEYFSCSRVCNL